MIQVISWDFISCAGLHNFERRKDRKIFESKEGQRGHTTMVFASDPWALNPRPEKK